MKKIILIFAITTLIMCGTGCSENSNLSEIQPQSSTEAASSDPAPESKPDTKNPAADAEISDSLSLESTSKATSSAAPAPGSKPEPVNSEISDSSSQQSTGKVTSSANPAPKSNPDTKSPANTEKTALDRFIGELEEYDCAVAYVGYIENADVKSVRECATKSSAAAKYPFISDIANDRIILAGGGEIYCVIPAKTSAKVTVNSLDLDENGAGIIGDELYTGDSAPILISCNVSDIMPNAAVRITNGDKRLKFSPSLSLRDGRLALPENLKILDFSEYGF